MRKKIVKFPTINHLCHVSPNSDLEIYEDMKGGIVIKEPNGEELICRTRRKAISYLKKTKYKFPKDVLLGIQEDYRDLGDKKGLVYNPNEV